MMSKEKINQYSIELNENDEEIQRLQEEIEKFQQKNRTLFYLIGQEIRNLNDV